MWTHLSHTHPVLGNGTATVVKVLLEVRCVRAAQNPESGASLKCAVSLRSGRRRGQSSERPTFHTWLQPPWKVFAFSVPTWLQLQRGFSGLPVTSTWKEWSSKKKKKCFESWTTNLNRSSQISLLNEFSPLKIDKYQRSFFSQQLMDTETLHCREGQYAENSGLRSTHL